MQNFYRDDDGGLVAMCGSSIEPTVKEAIRLAKREKGNSVTFNFNGVEITVEPNSDPNLILRDWRRALNGYIDKNVGPHPKAKLSKEEKDHDAFIEAENEKALKKRQAEYRKKDQAKREAVNAKLKDVPGIEVKEAKGWEQFKTVNTDGYGSAVVTYAERWARLMQLEISKGKDLKDVAESTSHEADIEGVTGFMFNCAVQALAHCWVHGEELRRWHNLSVQIGTEGEEANESGGVLNSAILHVQA